MRPAEAAANWDRAGADPQQPEITLAQAMAELDNMIGLESVKEQIRQITASVEAARRRELAGYKAEKPMQHFVFLGPPGTGKTSVARVIAKIFYAFGLLDTPRWWRHSGPTWLASTSAPPRSRRTSWWTGRSAGCCSSTRRTA